MCVQTTCRVVLVDDHPLVLAGLRHLIGASEAFEVAVERYTEFQKVVNAIAGFRRHKACDAFVYNELKIVAQSFGNMRIGCIETQLIQEGLAQGFS